MIITVTPNADMADKDTLLLEAGTYSFYNPETIAIA
jgi:hypothetical protein